MIRTKLPDTIKVGAYDYTIIARGQDWKRSVGAYGRCHTEEQTIEIVTEGITPIFQLDTFMHEILHAIFSYHALDDDDDEEKTVTLLASGLVAVLRDNPELVKFQNAVLRDYHKNNK